MKLVDVFEGQILTDADGNLFEVLEVDRVDDELPVCVKLIEQVSDFAVPDNEYEVFTFGDGFVGEHFWIDQKLSKEDKADFNIPCVDLHALKIFKDVEVPNELDEPDNQDAPKEAPKEAPNRSHLQTKACQEAEELYSIVHDMFVLPKPEEMRQLVKQHQLDDVFQVIRDAAKRGEQEVNLPQGDIDGIGGILIAAGYQVYFTGHPQRCYVRW